MRQVNRLAGMQPGGVRRERSLSQVLRFFLVFFNIFSGNIFPPGAGGLLLHHHPIPALTRDPPSTLPRDSAGDQLGLTIELPMRFQTCLLTGCLGQGEACLKAAIHLIGGFNFFGKSLSKFSLIGQSPACLEEKKLAEHLPSLLSTLLPLPDSPDRRPLHLARAALNAVNKFPWSQVSVLI